MEETAVKNQNSAEEIKLVENKKTDKKNFKNQVESAQKCSNLSEPLDVYFTEPVAMVFSKLFIKLNIHPNIVTLFSLIAGVVGGIFFMYKDITLNIIGILLEILCIIFDTSDGQVARLANKKSNLGRILDGIVDGLVYASIYIFLAIRLSTENIPFTETPWGFWIYQLFVITGIFHTSQGGIADYYRQLHMFFIKNERGNELSRTASIKEEIKNAKTFGQKIKARYYYLYTSAQERRSKWVQKLLDKIGQQEMPAGMSEDFTAESNKMVRKTNLITVNVRSYLLYVLILFNIPVYIIPFVFLVLEPIKRIIIARYEKIAKKVYNKYYEN